MCADFLGLELFHNVEETAVGPYTLGDFVNRRFTSFRYSIASFSWSPPPFKRAD